MRAFATTPACSLAVWLVAAGAAFAQAPNEPPKIWTVTVSAGLALTSGNSATTSTNVAYDIVYDPQRRNVVKSDGLFLRARSEGEFTSNRIGINIRDEYKLTPRFYVFGQNQYLKDEFKEIDYLLAPAAGLGYNVIDTDTTKLGLDGSIGGVWEKNTGSDVRSSGAVTAGEKLVRALTSNTTLTQTFGGLWKTNDFEDLLFIFNVTVAASMSTHTQLKVEVLDTFKNKPPPAVRQNDVAVLMALVYKR